jgi:hypothetical protein
VDVIRFGTFLSSAKPEVGVPIDVAIKAATKSLFMFIDERLLGSERCCCACSMKRRAMERLLVQNLDSPFAATHRRW